MERSVPTLMHLVLMTLTVSTALMSSQTEWTSPKTANFMLSKRRRLRVAAI